MSYVDVDRQDYWPSHESRGADRGIRSGQFCSGVARSDYMNAGPERTPENSRKLPRAISPSHSIEIDELRSKLGMVPLVHDPQLRRVLIWTRPSQLSLRTG